MDNVAGTFCESENSEKYLVKYKQKYDIHAGYTEVWMVKREG